MTELAWGIVGTGTVSRAIAADLALTPGVRRLAVTSREEPRAREFADTFSIERAYGGVEELLADEDVDILYIGTPHATHSDIAVRALEAGRHVLVEKPAGVDSSDVRRIADAARASGRFAMEGMWMRFAPAYRAAIEDIRNGAIGSVTSVRASFGIPFGDPESASWTVQRRSSTLLDQGIYPVTLALDVLGVPESLWATAHVRSDGVDLAVHATLEYRDHRFAQLAASMTGWTELSAAVSGSAGWLTLSPPFWATDRYVLHSLAGGATDQESLFRPDPTVHPREGFGYVPMLRAVTEAIADGLKEHPLHPLQDSITIAEILDRIRACATSQPQLGLPT